jgi:hypothetical protein
VDRLTCRGAALEANAPYLNVDNTTTCPTVTRYVAGVTGWAYAPNNERGFAQALTHNPFIFGVSGRDLQSYSAGVYGCGGTNAVDHVLTMVGYTMNVTMSTGGWPSVREKGGWVALTAAHQQGLVGRADRSAPAKPFTVRAGL